MRRVLTALAMAAAILVPATTRAHQVKAPVAATVIHPDVDIPGQ